MAADKDFLFAGTYVIMKERLPDYVVPDLTDFEVTFLANDQISSLKSSIQDPCRFIFFI